MKLHKNASKKYIKEYLESEIKEKSIRYMDLMIDKVLVENKIVKVSEHEEGIYTEVKILFGYKTEEECGKIFKELSETTQIEFNKVSEQKLLKEQLKRIEGQIKEKEFELELITSLKNKIII